MQLFNRARIAVRDKAASPRFAERPRKRIGRYDKHGWKPQHQSPTPNETHGDNRSVEKERDKVRDKEREGENKREKGRDRGRERFGSPRVLQLALLLRKHPVASLELDVCGAGPAF